MATKKTTKGNSASHHLRVDDPVAPITVDLVVARTRHSGGQAVANVSITVAVVLLGFIKGRFIIRYFMEVRTAPRSLKVSTDAWLVVLWAALLAIYLY